jgi:protein required for attachment to host cells
MRRAEESYPMSKLKIGQGAWVIVCDGAKALVLENTGDEKFPNLKTREVYEQDDPKTHEQGTDAPGRAINSIDARRSAMEQTDWHAQAEKAFLEKLVGRLNAAVAAGEAKRLIVVAPPRALGVIRQAYSPMLRQAIQAEVDKDYVKMPVHEIERHLVN